MVEFGEYIDAGHDVFEFRFTEVVNPDCPKYFVSVFCGQERMASFETREKDLTWEIVPPAPAWIKELEDKLNRIVMNHRRQKIPTDPKAGSASVKKNKIA